MTIENELWAVRVVGPDDLLAMPDRATAEQKAAEINERVRRSSGRRDAWPLDPARVVPWLGPAKAHAEHLAAFAGLEYTP